MGPSHSSVFGVDRSLLVSAAVLPLASQALQWLLVTLVLRLLNYPMASLSFFPHWYGDRASLVAACDLYPMVCILGFKKIFCHLVLLWMLSMGFALDISCSVFMWRFGKIQKLCFHCLRPSFSLSFFYDCKDFIFFNLAIFLEFRSVTFQTIWGRDLERISLAKTGCPPGDLIILEGRACGLLTF